MWKSACVGVYQLLNWKMHGETLKESDSLISAASKPDGWPMSKYTLICKHYK